MDLSISPARNIAFKANTVSEDFNSFKDNLAGFNANNAAINNDILAARQVQPESLGVSPIQGTKNVISGVQKAWINLEEYVKGTAMGIFVGIVTGGLTYGIIAGVKAIRSGIRNVKMTTMNKAASIGVGIATLGYYLFNASLNVSERTAGVDHRYNTGHRVEP